AGCHHNGCAGKKWHDLRDLVEPGWREHRAALHEDAGGTGAPLPSPPLALPGWPAPPAQEAYHGLAGGLVRLVPPTHGAPPAGLLVQTLVAFGNQVGRTAYFVAESDRHYANEFCVLVGKTAKGRKGSSWGRVQAGLCYADAAWAGQRVSSGLSSAEGLIWEV